MFRFTLSPTPDAWRARLDPWLAEAPARHALIVNVASQTADGGGWCGLVEDGDRVVLALAQTPPHPVQAATPHAVDAEAVQALVDGWRDAGLAPCGLNGPVDWVRAVTAALGRTVADEMGLRLHLLAGEPRCPHPPPGTARPVRPGERHLIAAWCEAFHHEVEPGAPGPSDPGAWLDRILPQILLWEHNGACSMARAARPFLGGWSINGVYTPPAQRGRGYGGAVVHALCRRLLDQGAGYLALYTDLANPTSNRIYRDIGFVPDLDLVRVRWA